MKFKPEPTLKVIDSITDPGSPLKTNEDQIGFNPYCAFVLDGATTLGDVQIMPGFDSDAAWLAQFAGHHFQRKVETKSNMTHLTRQIIDQARNSYLQAAGENAVERFAWPSASMAMLHLGDNAISFLGFGDCTLLIEDKHGQLSTHSPLSGFAEWESRRAGGHIERLGGMKTHSILSDRTTLEDMRAVRSRQNTPESDVWTLGIVPEAARHLHHETLSIELPAQGLLCSDGFYALVDTYRTHTDQSLMAAVSDFGLSALLSNIRDIEVNLDPDAKRFPRFKRSDDASALFFELY